MGPCARTVVGMAQRLTDTAGTLRMRSASEWMREADGNLIRRGCDCVCIPYSNLCKGRCNHGQCQEGTRCLEELEVREGSRIRTTCEGRCIPFNEKCVFS